MSEKQPSREHGAEQLKPVEHSNEHLKNHHEKEAHKAEKDSPDIEQLAQSVEQHAVSGAEQKHIETESTQNHHPVLVNKQLKNVAFDRALTRVRKKLSLPSRAFSKLIHTPAIDRSSEIIGKTAARPSSMLGGALFAFVGTSLLLWLTRRYGYEYNYLVVVFLFIGGWVFGLGVEGIWRKVRKPKA